MSATAGKGDPYWYEWTVGLLEVVKMLDQNSAIISVSFQVTGVKGWDDVVVEYSNGKKDYFQVKHTRVGDSITFGDLVAEGEGDNEASLLGSLFSAWVEVGGNPDKEKFILYTNRECGQRLSKTKSGIQRPALFNFKEWLDKEIKSGKILSEISPEDEWREAWNEWLSQLDSSSEEKKLDFLKSFEIRPNQEGLEEIEKSVLLELQNIFQLAEERAKPLLHSLDNALRRWSTTHETVTAEDAYSAMAINDDAETEIYAPPPPTPFFPSRLKDLNAIRSALIDPQGESVIFLSAEPGAGKTSLISGLTNSRVDNPLSGAVGIRYYAFRPITPDSPIIPPDSDYLVRPAKLWFALLSQLRKGLDRKLRAYQVPLRNSLISWQEARGHVLRIADLLGNEQESRFTIVIDGIDHAARAQRMNDHEAKAFFSSIPSPEEIAEKNVRLLIAGQPAESYPEYPVWLTSQHEKVKPLGIGKLDDKDIALLLDGLGDPDLKEHRKELISVILDISKGNTLAVVFAIEEARYCKSASELRDKLEKRNLNSGLKEYYRSIWRHALEGAPSAAAGVDTSLAMMICLTPEKVSGELMAAAYKDLKLNPQQWTFILAELGPLIIENEEGYQVLHNDVRVYLRSFLETKPVGSNQAAASMLVDYYLSPNANKLFAHKALLRLLRAAAQIFFCKSGW